MIEIVVALALLAFGLYGAADLVASARNTSLLTRNRMQATALAQLKLQELRGARENLPALFAQGGAQVELPSAGAEPFEQNNRYVWKAQLNRRDTTPPQCDILVTVGSAGDSFSTAGLAVVQGTVLISASMPAGAI